MNISGLVKDDYRNDSIHKYITLKFPEINKTINNDQIYSESLKLKESLCEKTSIEFVGCISSSFKIKVNNLRDDVKGKKIIAYIHTENTVDSPIKLFEGYVDSVVRDSNKRSKEITAYDKLYTAGNKDVSKWYNSLSFPISLKSLRNSLFNYIGIEQVSTSLPNDNVKIKKIYNPTSLQSLVVMKSICQINGAMGIMNRDGKFEYRILSRDIAVPTYPANNTYPSVTLYPYGYGNVSSSSSPESAEVVSYYRTVDFQEYTVRPIDKVTIRDSDSDAGVVYGTGTNNYIIQSNMFAKSLDTSVLKSIARNVYNCVGGFEFIPFKSSSNGLPWIECGVDAVSIQVYNYDYIDNQDTTVQTSNNTVKKASLNAVSNNTATDTNSEFKRQNFYVLNRELSGIQALKDSYSANGEQYQSEFITDVNSRLSSISSSLNSKIDSTASTLSSEISTLDSTVSTLDSTVSSLGTSVSTLSTKLDATDNEVSKVWNAITDKGGWTIESVTSIPTEPKANTIYLIQGEIIVR